MVVLDTVVTPPETRGSTRQFFLATAPLLGVLTYFLYLSYRRPFLLRYNLDKNADDQTLQEAYEDSEIPLMEMLWVFLLTGVSWCTFTVYAVKYIPKRRRLLNSYLKPGVKTVVGDIQHEKSLAHFCTRFYRKYSKEEYAFVTYTIQKEENKDGNFDERFFTSWANGKKLNRNNDVNTDLQKTETPDLTGIIIQKKIRTFFPFDREQVSVLVLPEKPRSGIPRADLEKDLSIKMDSSKGVKMMYICLFWILFTIAGSIYILFQMEKIDDEFEDAQLGWIIFACTWVVIMPGISLGWNVLRFFQYTRWLTDQGVVRPIVDDNENGGNYVQIQ